MTTLERIEKIKNLTIVKNSKGLKAEIQRLENQYKREDRCMDKYDEYLTSTLDGKDPEDAYREIFG